MGKLLNLVQRDSHDFHGLLGSGEGDVEVVVVFEDVGIVDVATADEVEEVGVDEAVLADGESERVPAAGVGVGDHGIVATGGSVDEELAGGVGEVGFDDPGPGLAVVGGECAKKSTGAAVVANETDDALTIR